MLQSYVRFALRTLRRRLGYTAVNVIGLTVEPACCALMAVFLQYERRYDAHHEDADRIYRILSERTSGKALSTTLFENSGRAGPSEQRSLARRLRETVPVRNHPLDVQVVELPEDVKCLAHDGRSWMGLAELASQGQFCLPRDVAY